MCSVWLLISGILYATTRTSSRVTGPPDPQMFKTLCASDMDGIPTEIGIWHLDDLKYIKLKVFEGKILVDIRDYYESTGGKLMPLKHGVTLSILQWKRLLTFKNEINTLIREELRKKRMEMLRLY